MQNDDAETHATNVVEVRDPYLGARFAVDCSWCGVFGREVERADAVAIAERHAERRTAYADFERRS